MLSHYYGREAALELREDVETVLEPGDLLVLYSDGIVERQGPEGEFGRERVESYVSDARDRGEAVAAMVDGLLDEVHRFGQGQEFADDVTAMVVRRQEQ